MSDFIIHHDEPPPDRNERRHTVVAKPTDDESDEWVKNKNIPEAWIYNLDGILRVIAWYEVEKEK